MLAARSYKSHRKRTKLISLVQLLLDTRPALEQKPEKMSGLVKLAIVVLTVAICVSKISYLGR